MDALSDTLYYALQGLETQLAMQHNRCIGLPCRQIVRTGVEVAQMMLGDELVEEHRPAYYNLIRRKLYGDQRDTVMTIVMMAVLFSLIHGDSRASRCRYAITDDWGDELYDIFHSYRSAVDRQIDSGLTIHDSHTYTISVMKTEQPQNVFYVSGNYIAQQNIDIHDNANAIIYASGEGAHPAGEARRQEAPRPEPEDVQPVDTSFFCAERFAPEIIEKNIRDAINGASSKADACRRLMALETYGYIRLSNVKDERKAELINPFAMPKLTFTGDDFAKARCRRTKQ